VPAREGRSLVAGLLAAPVGVVVLGRLEGQHGHRDKWDRAEDAPAGSDPGAVRRALEAVEEMPYGELVALSVECGMHLSGPWSGDSPTAISRGYRFASHRQPIAEAIVRRLGAQLEAPAPLDAQQAWLSATWNAGRSNVVHAFRDFEQVYGNGEFTVAGMWTVTAPPDEAHDELVAAWELYPPPTSRWRLPVRTDARLWSLHRPEDWVHLVESYPRVATEPHAGWELPGPNQRRKHVAPLLSVSDQHAVRTSATRHVLPDWRAVAEDYDGVHLSWAGFLTTEGFVSDLPSGGVTMLRYWSSERTLWLRDVFGDPQPLPAPALSGRMGGDHGLDVTADNARRSRDLAFLSDRLDRS
jgi:hypothetical protein